MKPTTAQRFGSLGKSFGAPAAAAAVIGAALLASDTSDTSETAWSPAAACLLPDVLPVAGTLLSYGGDRQLAAGGTVTHSGDVIMTGSANGIYLNPENVNKGLIYFSAGQNRLNGISSVPWVVESDAGFKVRNTANSADGPLTCGAITASGNVTTAGDLILASGTTGIRLVYNSSGVGTIYNHAGTDFGRLNLGGTTSSFPAIKRSGTTTAFRLADDSADGPISCGAITASGTVTIDNGSSEGILNLTGTTGRTGYIKHNGTTVLQLTAYSSGVTSYKPIYVAHADGLRTAGPIQETPTQSALDPTTTNIPSGKRQGWYNSTLSEFRDWVNIGGTLLKSAAYT